jgi:hypothetical protein
MASDSQQNIDGVMAINQTPAERWRLIRWPVLLDAPFSPRCEMDDWAQFDKICFALETDCLSSGP